MLSIERLYIEKKGEINKRLYGQLLNKSFTAKQGYRYHKLIEIFHKFYSKHHVLVTNFNVG